MSGEVEAAGESVGLLDKILSHVFTGTAADPVIAILLVFVGITLFVIWKMSKRMEEKDKKYIATVEKSNEEMKSLADKYVKTITEYHENQAEQTKIINDSLNGTRIILTEIKTLLTVMSQQHPR